MTYKLKKIIQISQGLIKRSKSAYFAYNSILCLGQFITLGFALIGSLAKIYNLLLEIPGVAKSKPKIESSMKEVTQVEDDIGVEIVSEVVTEPEASKDIKPELDDIFKSEKPKKKKSRSSTPSTIEDIFKSNKPKLKKKKKKKSAIDDIFG